MRAVHWSGVRLWVAESSCGRTLWAREPRTLAIEVDRAKSRLAMGIQIMHVCVESNLAVTRTWSCVSTNFNIQDLLFKL